jgi:hypothetical protein
MPYLHSASTAAIGATRLAVTFPLPLERAMAEVVCFSSAVRIGEAILPPACSFKAASRASPPIAARSSSTLHRSLYSAPTSAFAAWSGEREDIAGGGRDLITIGDQIAGSSEVDCFGH